MIVSHRHKLIFIKTLKTAGTSIEMAIANECGPADVVTPIFPAVQGHEPRNWRGWFAPWKEVHSATDLRKNLRECWQRKRMYNHIPARFARARMPKDIWDSYLKVAVDRNPWDKTLSHYHMFRNADWHRHYDPELTLDGYIDKGVYCHNAPFYCDVEGNVIVDRVLRYDQLDQELPALFKELDIPYSGLPQAKAGIRKDRRSYHDVFDGKQAQFIQNAFALEIRLHGWEY
ncbi:hypothetical protein [Loktanella sp. S4079]|uniref:hypothetical protein n=1 Tax=Loktanella sp. S4079 TaxID=579483 RepID=UPI000A4E3C3E|nr:hypothetical protein [Loktanella sp. S4079]